MMPCQVEVALQLVVLPITSFQRPDGFMHLWASAFDFILGDKLALVVTLIFSFLTVGVLNVDERRFS